MTAAWRLPVILLAVAALAIAGPAALADRGHHGAGPKKPADRLFTLQPDPAGNPEGVAYDGRSKAFFVSITVGGAIYRGTTGGSTVSPFIPGPGPGGSAVGLKVQRGKLYVAGGTTGTITVYDLATRQAIATFQTGAGGFLNDLVVTGRGDVFVTDSFRPVLWHVTARQVRSGGGTPQALDVSATIPYSTGFNLNGIVARGASRLIVVQTNTGKLFRIDLAAHGGAIKKVYAIQGATVPGGDGMILDAGRLVVVQGGPPAQLAFLQPKHGDRRVRLRGTRTSTSLVGPSTIARAKKLYLVVNADFANSAKPFTVAGLAR